MKIAYLAACFISLFELILFYESSQLNLNKNFLLLYTTTLISNLGYALLVFTKTLEGALIGNIFSYFGSIFTIFFMLYVIIEMCGKKMPLWLGLLLLAFSVAITIMVATTELNHFFYKEVRLDKLFGLTIIKTKNGPGMFIYHCNDSAKKKGFKKSFIFTFGNDCFWNPGICYSCFAWCKV